MNDSSATSAYSRIAAAAFIAVWLLAFAPTWRQWALVWWTSPQYDFGLVLALLTAHALLIARHGLVPRPDARWVAPLVGMSVAWMFAWLAGIAAAQQLAVIGWGALAACAFYGLAQARRIIPAIAWLAFASEIWEHLSVPLQSLVVAVVPPVMAALGLPSVVSGNRITIPAGIFIVEEGCSGVKYMISLLAFVCVLMYTMRFRWRGRLLLVALGIFMALAANWFRVGVLIAVGQATHMQHAMLRSHAVFGWIVFAVALVPVVLVARRLGEPVEAASPSAAAAAALPRARLATVPFFGMAILGISGPMVAASILLLPRAAASDRDPTPPAGWSVLTAGPSRPPAPDALPVSVWELASTAGNVRAGRVHSAVPARPEGLEVLFAAMDPGQPRTFTTLGRKGEIVTSGSHVIRFSEREMLESVGLRKVMRFWFDVGGRSYSGSAVAKAALALKAPLGTRFMTIHAVEAQCSGNCDSARALLDQFMTVGF